MKSPRDFVHMDELWPADDDWSSYFIGQTLWVYSDEYRAELTGDQDYCRIVIHAGNDSGLILKRALAEKAAVHRILASIRVPVEKRQLEELGFKAWRQSFELMGYT